MSRFINLPEINFLCANGLAAIFRKEVSKEFKFSLSVQRFHVADGS